MTNNFVRPVRVQYVHRVCGKPTKIARVVAELHARNPKSIKTAFCTYCHYAFPTKEFVWEGTKNKLGE
jgi:hypothetical protein